MDSNINLDRADFVVREFLGEGRYIPHLTLIEAQNSNFSPLVYKHLKALPCGRRLTRAQLRHLCNVDDRTIRRAIEDLRRQGVRVCSGGGEAGYYIATTDAEYSAFEREYLSRAYTALATAWMMRNNHEGQMEISYVD